MKITMLMLILSFSITAQTVYELMPGTKGNEIVLQLTNVSETEIANNLVVKILKGSEHLEFNKADEYVTKVESSSEKEISFTFDVKYNTNANVTDTVEFLVTNNKNIFVTKSFIFNYVGPKEYALEQNFPNPFNPSTKIRYTVPDLGTNPQVMLKVYDILGNEIETLVNEKQVPGYKEVDFNAKRLASGVYIYRLTADDPSKNSDQVFVSVKKMMLIK